MPEGRAVASARVLVRDLPGQVGRDVTVQGWVHAIRDQKRMQFLLVRDHTGMVQAALPRAAQYRDLNDTIAGLTRESAVTITGRLVPDERVKLGGMEIALNGLTIDGPAEPRPPLDPFGMTEPGPDVRLDWRFLDLRRPEQLLTVRVQTTVVDAMRRYWLRHGFVEIHSPKLMAGASESGAQVFQLEYFGRTAYLAQSPQFYKQMAIAAGFDRVFEIGPAFRAEPSFTARHATEFTSVDLEMAWIASDEDVMAFEERWLVHVLEAVRTAHGKEVTATFGVAVAVPRLPFPRVPLQDALAVVARRGHTPAAGGPPDLDPAAERLLSEWARQEWDHEFVFVTDYPHETRPFYHMRGADPALTRSFDLLWKGVEVTTGAQREHRHPVLVKQAEEKGLRPESLQFYLDFFRYGCPPHGGFGFGLARMLMVLLGRQSIRDVTYLFRGPTRLYP